MKEEIRRKEGGKNGKEGEKKKREKEMHFVLKSRVFLILPLPSCSWSV